LADRVDRQDKAGTIGQLLDRYALQVIPAKEPTTQASNQLALVTLRKVFGAMPIGEITPQHIYKYVDKRSVKKTNDAGRITGGRTVAHREIEVLSHAFTKAVEWGYIARHPFKGEVRLQGEKPRTRYIEDWEIVECLALESRQNKGSVNAIHAYIRLKLMTGMARSDLLRLTSTNLREDGIYIQRHKTAGKTGKRTIYEWTPELRAAVEMARQARPVLSPFLFCNRKGEGYIDEETGLCHGWDSMWGRFMDRVLKETKVKDRFTEHDLRAKCASDAESLEHARALLSHADARTTETIYRRKPERVKPLNSKRCGE
jgi:integrase